MCLYIYPYLLLFLFLCTTQSKSIIFVFYLEIILMFKHRNVVFYERWSKTLAFLYFFLLLTEMINNSIT